MLQESATKSANINAETSFRVMTNKECNLSAKINNYVFKITVLACPCTSGSTKHCLKCKKIKLKPKCKSLKLKI